VIVSYRCTSSTAAGISDRSSRTARH
jgi:hypothetical protein